MCDNFKKLQDFVETLYLSGDVCELSMYHS